MAYRQIVIGGGGGVRLHLAVLSMVWGGVEIRTIMIGSANDDDWLIVHVVEIAPLDRLCRSVITQIWRGIGMIILRVANDND